MRLEIKHISKFFPGVRALDDVSFEVAPGEVHAVCGENGAGKSTLMHILAGNLQADAGQLLLDGREVRFRSPQDAAAQGISIVYQHLSLCENLSVGENMFAMRPPRKRSGWIHYAELHRRSAELLARWGVDLLPQTEVSRLPAAQKQVVEIVKALAADPALLILDEPTASLGSRETEVLAEIMAQLTRRGASILYISHRLSEIFQLAGRITVLKDGSCQGTFPRSELDEDSLIRLMTGRDLSPPAPRDSVQAEALLEVRGISGKGFKEVRFSLHKGEILGLAGLAGAGRSEIARAIMGEIPFSGEIRLKNEPLLPLHPADAWARGIAYVSDDRKNRAMFPEMGVQDNMMAANMEKACMGPFYRASEARRLAETYQHRLHIATPALQQPIRYLSGGNQQKAMLARALMHEPHVLVLEEPTQGIDAGARHEIYQILRALAQEGKAILLISSELAELLLMCDRILAVKGGRIAGEAEAAGATEEKILGMIL